MNNNQIPTNYFTMELAGEDADLMTEVVNQGIDSRLEGFTRSTFQWHIHTMKGTKIPLDEWSAGGGEKRYGRALVSKLHCTIHPAEMQILIRRLVEIGDYQKPGLPNAMCDNAFSLADSIVEIYHDIDLWLLEEKHPNLRRAA